MIPRTVLGRTLQRIRAQRFAAPAAKPAAAAPAPVIEPQTGPVVIPEQYKRDKNFFPENDRTEKREITFHAIKTMHDALKKHLDIINVEEHLLPKEKIVIFPLRVRHELDTLDHLHSKRLLPLHIWARDGEPGIECVIDQSQVIGLRKVPNVHYRPVYVNVNGKEIRCTVDKIIFTPDKSYYFKVYMRRYVVGQPNIIKVELTLPVLSHEAFKRKQVNWIREEMELVSYNDVHPARIELDFLRLARNQKITYGDLQNILPRGLELPPEFQNRLSLPVVEMVSLESKLEEDIAHRNRTFLRPTKVVQKRVFDLGKPLTEYHDLTQEDYQQYIKEAGIARKIAAGIPIKEKRKPVSAKLREREEQAKLREALEAKLAKADVLMKDKPKKDAKK